MQEQEVRLHGLMRKLQICHYGRGKAISGKDLAEYFGANDAKRIREAVNSPRRSGHLIGSCHDGYFIPANREEALEAYSFITALFDPLRRAVDGYRAAMEREFGGPQLFDDMREAS